MASSKEFTKIIIDTPNGQYELPIDVVAEDRTKYYAGVDGYEEGDEEWDAEMYFVRQDNYEAIDWLLNNMDWEDVEDFATKINDKVLVTDDDFWTDSHNFRVK